MGVLMDEADLRRHIAYKRDVGLTLDRDELNPGCRVILGGDVPPELLVLFRSMGQEANAT